MPIMWDQSPSEGACGPKELQPAMVWVDPVMRHEERTSMERCRSNQLRIKMPFRLALRKPGIFGPQVSAVTEASKSTGRLWQKALLATLSVKNALPLTIPRPSLCHLNVSEPVL